MSALHLEYANRIPISMQSIITGYGLKRASICEKAPLTLLPYNQVAQ
jgi:hypothetical protein